MVVSLSADFKDESGVIVFFHSDSQTNNKTKANNVFVCLLMHDHFPSLASDTHQQAHVKLLISSLVWNFPKQLDILAHNKQNTGGECAFVGSYV